MSKQFYFFQRGATPEGTAGVTVSKKPQLPTGDFTITKYTWNRVMTLWFIDDDKFTYCERMAAAYQYGASAQS